MEDPDAIQYDAARYLGHGPSKRQLRAMRGFGKSIMSAALALWWLYRNPNETIIVVSGVANLSQDFTRMIRKLMDAMEICHHLRPGLSDKDGAVQFICGARDYAQKDPSVWCCGVSSNKTGHHANKIIIDDGETPENSDTVEKREKLLAQLFELEDLLNTGPDAEIVVLNTPQSNDSVYLVLEQRKYAARVYPSRHKDPNDPYYKDTLAPFLRKKVLSGEAKVGDPTYPRRFSDTYLLQKEAAYGTPRFLLQMDLDTRLSDANRFPLKLRDFIVYHTHRDVAPKRVVWGTSEPVEDILGVCHGEDKFYWPIMVDDEPVEYTTSVMFIDPSGGGTVSGDEVGYCVAKVCGDTIYVLTCGGLSGGHSRENLRTLAAIAAEYKIKHVVVEENYGKGMFSKLLAPVMGDINGDTQIDDLPSGNTQKEKRIIDTLLPLLGSHRIVLDPAVARDTALSKQITGITYSRGCLRHDDRIEALAGACTVLAKVLPSVSSERAEQINAAERRRRAYEDWKTKPTLESMQNVKVVFMGGVSDQDDSRSRIGLDRWKNISKRQAAGRLR